MTLIYFAGSITGGRDDVELYGQIIEHQKKYGKVLTEHIGNKELLASGETNLSDPEIHDRDMGFVALSKVLVAEVTIPSLGVGYEIGRSVERNTMLCKEEMQRILCLHRPSDGRRLSPMIAGCEGLTLREYTNIEEARIHIDDFFAKR